MGERKRAWDTFRDTTTEGDGEQIWRAQRMVESAVISEFTSDVCIQLEGLQTIAEQSGNPGVVLGIQLAIREMLNLEEERS
jgi:hypothetical protein